MTSPPVDIKNIAAFLRVVGQWNLYDMQVRRIRYGTEQIGTGTLELSLYLGAADIRPLASGAPAMEYEFVFRFEGAEGLFIDDFAGSIIGEFAFDSRNAPNGKRFINVSLSSICAGDIRFLCASISVVSVREIPTGAT